MKKYTFNNMGFNNRLKIQTNKYLLFTSTLITILRTEIYSANISQWIHKIFTKVY